jgi:heme/copper-type cytochrome/quinol oxidase subunit 1
MSNIRSMEVLETLSVALGLATLAGINLYLTVFVTGMAVQFGWVVLPPSLHDLSVLANPWVIAISGALYLLEFCADKVPWTRLSGRLAARCLPFSRWGKLTPPSR